MSILSFAKRIAGSDAKTKTKPADAKPEKKSPKATPAASLVQSGALGAVGLEPLISEKGVIAQSTGNVVVFRVHSSARKPQIAAAVREQYGVMPVAVRTVAQRGKRRRRGKTSGFTSDWKKAYVQLPVGKSIDVTA